MKKALALILVLLMLCSVSVTFASAADVVDIDMLAVSEAAGYKAAYAGAPIDNGPTLDGKIEPGEYTKSRVIAKSSMTKPDSTEIESDVTEYFAHNENYVFYAVQFKQSATSYRSILPAWKPVNSFNFLNADSAAEFYACIKSQCKLSSDNYHYYTDPGFIYGTYMEEAGFAKPVAKDDIHFAASVDANNIKTYEVKFSKGYIANQLGIDISEVRVFP